MRLFNIDKIPSPLKDTYIDQRKWCDMNWQEALKKHYKELNKLLEKVTLFDVWSNELRGDKVTKSLIPEIFMDAFISLHFACMGLYKYANSCLRSELETTLRLVYFSTHPVEFEWWCNGNEWYKGRDVWGEGYMYFEQLKTLKDFDKKLPNGEKLFARVRKIYGILSQYVHSSKSVLQTSLKFSPKYNTLSFKNWCSNFKEIQQSSNIIIALGFNEDFKKMRKNHQEKIIKIGLIDRNYKKSLKDIFGLKFKGRL